MKKLLAIMPPYVKAVLASNLGQLGSAAMSENWKLNPFIVSSGILQTFQNIVLKDISVPKLKKIIHELNRK